MDSIDFNTHEKFRNFPPLYTEQVNNLTLSKQLDIWHKIIKDEILLNSNLYTLGPQSLDSPPFKNSKISRNVNSSFLALILEYLVEKQYAFYLHPIHLFCKKNNVTVWGALFVNWRRKGSNLLHIQLDYSKSLKGSPRGSPRIGFMDSNEIEELKRRRESLIKSSYTVGVFPHSISEMTESVLNCIKSQCTTRDIETVYYLFYSRRDINNDFSSIPEDHLAFLLSTLSHNNKINLSFNDSVSPSSLNNMNVGVQPV